MYRMRGEDKVYREGWMGGQWFLWGFLTVWGLGAVAGASQLCIRGQSAVRGDTPWWMFVIAFGGVGAWLVACVWKGILGRRWSVCTDPGGLFERRLVGSRRYAFSELTGMECVLRKGELAGVLITTGHRAIRLDVSSRGAGLRDALMTLPEHWAGLLVEVVRARPDLPLELPDGLAMRMRAAAADQALSIVIGTPRQEPSPPSSHMLLLGTVPAAVAPLAFAAMTYLAWGDLGASLRAGGLAAAVSGSVVAIMWLAWFVGWRRKGIGWDSAGLLAPSGEHIGWGEILWAGRLGGTDGGPGAVVVQSRSCGLLVDHGHPRLQDLEDLLGRAFKEIDAQLAGGQ